MNNSRILTIKNAKLSGYYFYMNLNIWGDFKICISVPLNKHFMNSSWVITTDVNISFINYEMIKTHVIKAH